MTVHFPIVLETEASGAVSAYVPGLPVYAAADSHAKAERAIRVVLTAYLQATQAAGHTLRCASRASQMDKDEGQYRRRQQHVVRSRRAERGNLGQPPAATSISNRGAHPSRCRSQAGSWFQLARASQR